MVIRIRSEYLNKEPKCEMKEYLWKAFELIFEGK